MAEVDIFNNYLGQNATGDYYTALVIFLVVFVGLMIVDRALTYASRKAMKSLKKGVSFSRIVLFFAEGISWPFHLFMGLYFGLASLALIPTFRNTLNFILILFIAFYGGRGVIFASEILIRKKVVRKEEGSDIEKGKSALGVLSILIKLLVWSVAFLMVLAYLGIDVTPLIAGLGVGGIAVALALQAVLGDLFAAFAIYFDKPFEEGDFVIIGDDMGVIKKVGIKTTRIQALGGQELVVSNTEMTSTRINNYKKMEERRVAFHFGVEYSTPSRKLKKINEIVEKTCKGIKGVRFDRSHFQKFGDFSLNYEVVYYINTNDYNKFMDIQQEINFKLKEAFEKEKIVFAFPTQTLFLRKD
jgi:small-conductance mechanosensitive channel